MMLCKSLFSRPKLLSTLSQARRMGASYFALAYDRGPSTIAIDRSGQDPISGAGYIRMVAYGTGPLYASSCNGLLEKYLKLELTPRIAAPFLAQMVLRGAVPDLLTFSLITKSYCKQFRYQRVLDAVLTQMKALEVEATISFYKNLISSVCASFGPVVAYKFLKKVRSGHGVEMPLSCYNALVPQFIKPKHIYNTSTGEVFVKLMMHMKRHRVFPDQKLVDTFLKARYIYKDFLKTTEGIGRQMFAEGIKIGVVQRRGYF